MASVFDTANYILKKQGKMSTMKLQKLCYYAQAWALVWNDTPLFDEDFQAWANGPVCPRLFFKTQGQFAVTADDIPGDNSVFTEDQANTIDQVLEYYAPHNAQWLSQLTHLEDPWKEARKCVPVGMRSSQIISKESMAMYYGGL